MIHPDSITNPMNSNFGKHYDPPISDGCTVTQGMGFVIDVYNLVIGAGVNIWGNIPYQIIETAEEKSNNSTKECNPN